MIRVITDSTASIPAEMAKEHGIQVVTMRLTYKGVEYDDATMDLDEFYKDIQSMVDDIPTSSQPSQAQLEEVFEDAAKVGDEVCAVFMGARMSGTVNGAALAARSVKERYPDFEYRVIDSTSNSFDEGWGAFEAAAARDEGCDLEECCKRAVHAIKCSRYLFTPESLRFLKAGGRIGGAAALLGNLIKLCPIITVSEGQADTFGKARTQKNAIKVIVEKFKADVEEYGLKNVVVHYIGDSKPAIAFAREFIDPIAQRVVDVIPVSACVGLHVGPAVAVTYLCKREIAGKLSPNYPQLVFSS